MGLTLAKMCKENKDYTDCVVQCDGGIKIKTHRPILGSASSFLKLVFKEVPPSLPEATIMVPGVKTHVVQSLIDFLYSGEMTVNRSDTADLQLLIDTLQIDPNLLTIGGDDNSEDESESETSDDVDQIESEETTDVEKDEASSSQTISDDVDPIKNEEKKDEASSSQSISKISDDVDP